MIFLTPGKGFSALETTIVEADPIKVAGGQEARRQALARDRATIETLRRGLETLHREVEQNTNTLGAGQVSTSLLEKAQLDLATIRLQQDDLREQVTNAQRHVQELEEAIRALHSEEQLLLNPAVEGGDEASRSEQLAATRQTLLSQETNLELEQQHLLNARSRLEIGNERLAIAEEWLTKVEQAYRLQAQQARQAESQNRIAELQQTLRVHRGQAATLTQELQREREQLSEKDMHILELALQHVEEQAQLVEQDIRLIQNDTRLNGLRDLIEDKAVKPPAINKGLASLETLEAELSANLKLLARKAELYDQQQRLSEQRETTSAAERQIQADEIESWSTLVAAINDLQRRLQAQLVGIEQFRPLLLSHHHDRLSQDLFRRAEIPSTAKGWRNLRTNMLTVPGILMHQVQLSLVSTYQSVLEDEDRLRWTAFIAMAMGIVILVFGVRRYLDKIAVQLKQSDSETFSREFAAVLVGLARDNTLGIGLFLVAIVALWLFEVIQPARNVILTLVMIVVGTKLAVNLARLLLI